MRALLFAGLGLALVLEPTLGSRLAVLGARPRLLLGMVVLFSLVRGATAGTLFGMAVGLLTDLMGPGRTGLGMIGLSVVGFVMGNAWASIYKDSAWTQAGLLFLGVLIYESITYMVVTGIEPGGYPMYTLRYAVPNGLITGAAFPLILLGIKRLFRREISFDARRVVVRGRR